MDLTTTKSFIFKLFIMEMIVFACAALLWLVIMSPQTTTTPFYQCLFITGAIFAGLGALFYFSAHNATIDDYTRRAWTGTSMSHSESGRRAWQDITASYFQSSLFLWAGLIAVGIGYALYDLNLG